MSFSQALSGLKAASTSLDVIGNNIANSQTVGFKGSRTLFADVYAGAQAGLGVRVTTVQQDFGTGMLESTGRNLDLAVAGEGFFRFIQNDQVVYSRNGQLIVDAEGYMVNAQGARLTGYPPGVGSGGTPVDLRVPTEALGANATTNVEAAFNLDAGSDVILPILIDDPDDPNTPPAQIPAPFDPTNPDMYSYANNATVYDSLGNAHNVTLYFTKTGVNGWEVRAGLGDNVVGPETIGFDTNGILNPADSSLNFDFGDLGNGSSPLAFDFEIAGTTQFGNDFEMSAVNQDGYSSGSLVGVTIDESGRIIGNYSNQRSNELGRIVLATFSNLEGLNPIGDNVWVETTASGQAMLGLATHGQFGTIESGVVENSNVDLASELVNLIIAQRNYQANSQTIKVQDDVLQTAVNLR